MYKAIFFDLDGTLLPMDTKEFMEGYFQELGAFFAQKGLDAKKVLKGVWDGTGAMMRPDGETTNEERFWEFFLPFMGEDQDWMALFEEFYDTCFPNLQQRVTVNPLVGPVIDRLHQKGYRLVLTTNPLFPPQATAQRIAWTGADPAFFERITAYHNSLFAKPMPDYFTENLRACGLAADEVLVVGNDLRDDGVASLVGLDVYIVTDCLLTHEKGCVPLEELRHGTMQEFAAFVETLPDLA